MKVPIKTDNRLARNFRFYDEPYLDELIIALECFYEWVDFRLFTLSRQCSAKYFIQVYEDFEVNK